MGRSAAVALLGVTSAFAQVTWTGVAGDGNPLTPSNWDTTFSPSSITDLTFPATAAAQTLTIGSSFVIRDITFSGAARPAYTFAGTGTPTITIYGNVAANSSSAANADVTFGSTLNLALSAGAHTADVGNGVYLNVNGVLRDSDGASSLVKAGGGTLVLAGTNTFSGSTTINNGYISIGADHGLGAAPGSATASKLTLNGGALAVSSSFELNSNRGVTIGPAGGAFNVGTGLTLTYSGIMTGSGALALQTGGALVLTGANTYSGTFSNIGSILQLGNGGTTGSLDANIQNSGALVFNRGDDVLYANAISGGGTVTKSGAGHLYLSNANTTGGVTINGGYLTIGTGGTTGSLTGNVTLNTGELQFLRADAYTFGGNITGTGTVSNYGGALTLGGANTYGGNTFVAASIIPATAASLSDSVAGAYSPNSTMRVQTGATLNVTQNETIAGLNNFGGAADNNGSVVLSSGKTLTIGNGATNTFGGVISGAGSLAKKNPGTLNLTGANTYTGGTTINDGTLALTGGSLAATSILNLAPSAGTTAGFNLGAGQAQTIAALNFSGSASTSFSALSLGTGSTLTLGGDITYTATNNPGAASISGGTLELGAARTFNIGNSTSTSNELTVGSVISGAGFSLTKSGAGTLLLSGASNSYTGGTVVNAGILAVTDSTGLGTSTSSTALTLNGGTVQFLNNSDTTFSGTNTVVAADATLTPDRSTTSSFSSVTQTLGSLSIGGQNLLIARGSHLTGTSNTGGIVFAGTTTLSGAPTFNVAANTALTLGAITGTNSDTHLDYGFAKQGAGSLTLKGAFNGPLTSDAGAISLANTGARGSANWTLTDTAASVDVTAANGATAPFRGSTTITTTFNGASSLLAKTNYAVSGGTQIFNGTSVFTASGDHVIVGGYQTFNTPENPLGGVSVTSESFASQLTALTDADVGANVLPYTARLTVDRFSSDTTIMGGTQIFTGYSSLQANHKGAVGTNSNSQQYFSDDAHLRASKASAILGGTQVFNGSAFLWAKTTDATTPTSGAVNGGTQIFAGYSSLIADSINSVTGGNQSFSENSLLSANVTSAITGVTLSLWDNSEIDVNALNALSATTNISFNGNLVHDAAKGGRSLLEIAGGGGGQLALFANTTVGALNSTAPGAGMIALNGNTLTTTSSTSASFSGTLSGDSGSKLIKQGTGTLELSGASAYFNGVAQIDAGTLRLLGSFNAGSITNVNATGTIAGTGALGALNLTGGSVAPGNPVGTLSASTTTFGADGHYAWDLANANGTAGTGWDLLSLSGALTINATTDHPFVFDLKTVSADTNFNSTISYNFAVVNASSVLNFNPALFQINSSAFQSALNGGAFSLSSTGTQLVLNFTPVPEPSTWALLLSGLGVLALGARRRLRRR